MNILWTGIFIISILMLLVNPLDNVFSILILGGTNAVNLSIKLLAIYGVWCGILSIMEDTGLNKKLSKFLNPIISFLFGKDISAETKEHISLNLTSNVLGMGNVSIPSGIKAVSSMYKGESVATHNMIMFLILNVCSIQLVPTTVIGLMSASGSNNISGVVLAIFITSVVSVSVGVILCKIFRKIFK
ncbi:MAG: hypothetical protein IJW28_00310 [Clostridia bacterium]|nr:hypothetical protein [Clostridia bacterium]